MSCRQGPRHGRGPRDPGRHSGDQQAEGTGTLQRAGHAAKGREPARPSIIQKKVVSPNDFAGLDELCRTLLAFAGRYNQTARPFNWKFTTSALTALIRRISEQEQPV